MTFAPPRFAVRVITRLLRMLARTWRVTIITADGRTLDPAEYTFAAELYAISERDVFALMPMGNRGRVLALVAEGTDGDWASVAAAELQIEAVRGSSLHHGAAASLSLVRELRNGTDPALVVVDGPLGPQGVAKEGVAALAALSGRPLCAVAAAAHRALVFANSWSKIFVPLPFARVVLARGNDVRVDRRSSRAVIAGTAAQLTEQLSQLTAAARSTLRGRPEAPA